MFDRPGSDSQAVLVSLDFGDRLYVGVAGGRLYRLEGETLAELAAGPHAAADVETGARRQDRLQRVEAMFDPLPFDVEASRAYGRVYAATVAAGRRARGMRAVDLMIAATACAEGIPLYTRNPGDFRALHDIIGTASDAPRIAPDDRTVRHDTPASMNTTSTSSSRLTRLVTMIDGDSTRMPYDIHAMLLDSIISRDTQLRPWPWPRRTRRTSCGTP